MARKRILVTGDHGLDYDIYRYSDEDNPPAGTSPTIMRASVGGAGIAYRILLEAARASSGGATFDLEFATNVEPGAPIVAIWHPDPLGGSAREAADERSFVWRTRRSLSLGNVDDAGLLVAATAATAVPSLDHRHTSSEILVLEDHGGGLRFTSTDELERLIPRNDVAPKLVLLKTCWPVCYGNLWWHLAGSTASSPSRLADWLVVILAVKDLRHAASRVSEGISWERTAEDLVRELTSNPALSELRRARHVIVTLNAEGALLMERTSNAEQPFRFRLFFDSSRMENEWADTAAVGNAYGFNACFTSAIAAQVGTSDAATSEALQSGIARGLLAMRALRILGHGPTRTSAPALPAAELGELIVARDIGTLRSKIDLTRLGDFGSADVPAAAAGRAASTWRILEASDHVMKGQPLYGKARRVAIFGAHELRDVPCIHFGQLVTADRDEIESLRNLKRLMDAYANDVANKPLSLAVFGPPGAGKSFGIKQVAEAVIPTRKRALLEFNLSQFKDADDLIGAFHQVRDRVLDGKLPVVFWDEFDARSYHWLQFLLAPMQDGKFQEGQITHPIGQCIFVFAGATSYTFEDFGPSEVPASKDPEDRRQHQLAWEHFVLSKGPDFKSRLHGTLNVLGPNPRQLFNGHTWEDDPSDVCFPVRRAILLRSLLGLMDSKHQAERLDIDPGLLAALLEARHYRHGSRSFEKVVLSLKAGAKRGFQRAALPSDEVLAMNLNDLAEFKRILDQPLAFQGHADVVAAAIHARWLATAGVGNTFRVEFEKLDPESQGDNRAAAWRIPAILGLVGLELVPLDDPRHAVEQVKDILEDQVEILAGEEHAGWMDVRMKNGWRPIARTDDLALRKQHRATRLHDCLIPYSKLPESEKEKDRDSIRWYPEMARLAGFKMVAKGFAAAT